MGAETQTEFENLSLTPELYDGFYFTSAIPEGWNVIDQWRINRDLVILGNGESAIAITVKQGVESNDLTTFTEHELSAFKEIHPGYVPEKTEEDMFSGEPATRVSGSYESSGSTIDVTSLYCIVDGKEIAITLSAPEGVGTESFKTVFNSFSLKQIDKATSGDLELWSDKNGAYSFFYPDILHVAEPEGSDTISLKNTANHTVMKFSITNSTMDLDEIEKTIPAKMIRENITVLNVTRLTVDENPAVLIMFEQPNAETGGLKGFEIYIPIKNTDGDFEMLSIVSAYPTEKFNEVYPILADIVNNVRIPAKSKDKYWYFDPYEYMTIDDWIEYGILTDYMDYGLDVDLWNYGYGLTFTDADYMKEMLGWDNYYLWDSDTSSYYMDYDPTYIADLWAMDPDEYFAADHLVETAYDDF